MKSRGVDFAYLLQYILTVLTGYIVVYVFVVAFGAATQTNTLLRLSAPVSEVTGLILATIITMPIILPFAWKRLSKLKLGELEINLSDVSATVKLTLADELRDVQRLAMGASMLPNLIDKLALAISAAETSRLVEIELGDDKPPWWSTRLYLLAALAADYTNIDLMTFLTSDQVRDRIYIGSASPIIISHALAANNPKLSAAYEAATKISAPEHDAGVPEKRVAWIAQNYVWQFNAQEGEEQIKEIVTKEFLERCRVLTGKSVDWGGGPVTTWLIHDIIEHSDPYVALVKPDGRLNLVVDRMKLAEQVAKVSLRNQLK